MTIDYKKELEAASKGMIMIHDPRLLIKLIVRSIVSKVKIRHAGMILYNPLKDIYVLNISRGELGLKIPAGYARFDKGNPLIKIFTLKKFRPLTVNRNALIAKDISRMIWRETLFDEGNGAKELLQRVDQEMQTLSIEACVPAYYQDSLLAILLLGEKSDGCKFTQEELNFMAALASDVAMAIKNAQLFADLKKQSEHNRNLFIQTTFVLASAIEAKDKYTHGHTERVTHLSVEIARQMEANGSYKYPPKFLENLYIAGLLHDIGKIGIPEAILNKTGKLTPEEYEIMKLHPLRGAEMLKPLTDFQACVDGVKYHHERYDGKGYPEGLKGDTIPMVAAIIAVADTLDAMTTDRSYRKGLTTSQALEEIKKHSGTQFHPLPVKALEELFAQGKL